MKYCCKEESCQVSKVLIDCWKQFNPIAGTNHVHLDIKLAIQIAYFLEK